VPISIGHYYFKKTPKRLLEHENISCSSVDLAVEADRGSRNFILPLMENSR
jgi:hypothetical protein